MCFFNEAHDHGQDAGLVETTRRNLRSWKASLKSLRWRECIIFVAELDQVRNGLIKKWDLLRFVQALPKEMVDMPGEGHGFQGQKTVKSASTAILSDFFWAYTDLMVEVASAMDNLSRWSEGCFLHGSKCTSKTCVYKGCRAAESAEMAAGIHKWVWVVKHLQQKSNLRVFGIMHSLEPEEAQSIASDWHCAVSRLQLEVEVQLGFWDRLPYKLFGLNCSSLEVARTIGQQCQFLWSQLCEAERRSSHPMTRRFLDSTWRGQRRVCIMKTRAALALVSCRLSSPNMPSMSGLDDHFAPASGDAAAAADSADPALYSDLESFIHGGDVSPHFKMWLEGLAPVKIQDWFLLPVSV